MITVKKIIFCRGNQWKSVSKKYSYAGDIYIRTTQIYAELDRSKAQVAVRKLG